MQTDSMMLEWSSFQTLNGVITRAMTRDQAFATKESTCWCNMSDSQFAADKLLRTLHREHSRALYQLPVALLEAKMASERD